MSFMCNSFRVSSVFTVALLALAAGCSQDRPRDYASQRPDVGQLDERDRGLQSKDVVSATDQLAVDLLQAPELNASRTQWTMVVTNVENQTSDPRYNLDIFTERFRVNLNRYGKGRVTLIENKAKFADLRNRELGGERDDFGQGGGGVDAGSGGIQPDYALYGRIIEMPNRGTSYFFCQFNVTDLRTRQQVWSNAYEVKVAR